MPDLWLWLAIIATNLLIVAVFIYAYLKFQDVFGYIAEHERRLEALECQHSSALIEIDRDVAALSVANGVARTCDSATDVVSPLFADVQEGESDAESQS